mmetsp:Transcript_1940/g.6428  ORF Transcript_1940/g.6428 Transcript_1940/m.6428 type:complete len:274 (+) Transcript_1940:1109-1930(+)
MRRDSVLETPARIRRAHSTQRENRDIVGQVCRHIECGESELIVSNGVQLEVVEAHCLAIAMASRSARKKLHGVRESVRDMRLQGSSADQLIPVRSATRRGALTLLCGYDEISWRVSRRDVRVAVEVHCARGGGGESQRWGVVHAGRAAAAGRSRVGTVRRTAMASGRACGRVAERENRGSREMQETSMQTAVGGQSGKRRVAPRWTPAWSRPRSRRPPAWCRVRPRCAARPSEPVCVRARLARLAWPPSAAACTSQASLLRWSPCLRWSCTPG